MFPTSFDESNNVLGPPEGTSLEDCSVLSVFQGTISDGEHADQVVISCWKPTQEELDKINRTGRVWLYIWGPTMPPAAVSGYSPFQQEANGQEADTD